MKSKTSAEMGGWGRGEGGGGKHYCNYSHHQNDICYIEDNNNFSFVVQAFHDKKLFDNMCQAFKRS